MEDQLQSSKFNSFFFFLQEDCMTSFFEHQELRGINCCSCAHCGTRTPFKQAKTFFLKKSKKGRCLLHNYLLTLSSPQTFMVSQGVKLRSLPRILCIHLKRFRNTRGLLQKLHSRVTFPEHLDMAQILTEAFSTDFAQVLLLFPLVFLHDAAQTLPKNLCISYPEWLQVQPVCSGGALWHCNVWTLHCLCPRQEERELVPCRRQLCAAGKARQTELK